MRKLKGPQNSGEENAWQKYCTGVLRECIDLPEEDRASEWRNAQHQLKQLARRLIAKVREQRIIIADFSTNNTDLRNFDFRYCYIVRSNFERCDLTGCRFDYAIIRNCQLNHANLTNTHFGHADIEDSSLLDVVYDKRTNWNLSNWQSGRGMSPRLEERIQQDRLKASDANAPFIVRFLNFLTGHGIGIGRVFIGCALIISLFSVLYFMIDRQGFVVSAGGSSATSLTFWNFLLLSLERFVNASSWVIGISPLAQFLTILETIVGLLALAILIAMVVRQVLRR